MLTLECNTSWSKTTLNYWMMVERYPNLKEEVGSSFPGCETSSLLAKIFARWSTASCALTLTCQPSVSKRKRGKKEEKKKKNAIVAKVE